MSNYLEELRIEVLKDKEIKDFVKKFSLTDEEIDSAVIKFYQYINAKKCCAKCNGLDHCLLDSDGMSMKLKFDDHVRLLSYACKYSPANPEFLETLFYDGEIPQGEVELTGERTKVFTLFKNYLANPKKGKGLYIHGKYGTGKTFLLLSFAKRLSKMGVKTVFVYYPEFANKIKMNIGKISIDPYIETCKHADVLMIDDIGGEKNSAFLREDVLERILQYRMLCNLPTFFSSNFDYEGLAEHLAKTSDSVDLISASRVVERIKATAIDVELIGQNRRS